jgi:hypothetical protein
MAKKLPLKTRIENYLLAVTPEEVKKHKKDCPYLQDTIDEIRNERKAKKRVVKPKSKPVNDFVEGWTKVIKKL